jgi:CBS domain-containing protein
MEVRQIMTTDPEFLSPSASIREAADMMKGMDVGSVPIVTNRRVIGIVTDRDLVVRGIAGGLSPQAELNDIFSHDVKTVSPDDNVDQAFKMMEAGQIRRLPVVDGAGELVGMLSIGDLATRTEDATKAGQTLQEISESD